MILGIRREDKSKWERRVPIIPAHAEKLIEKGFKIVVESSENRIFKDEEFERVGCEIKKSLEEAKIIVGVKEIPPKKILENKVYMIFSHTFKGQKYNMEMLATFLKKGCTLIDYELITDEKNDRIIFFGRFAGLAGIIETLYGYGQKFKKMGYDTPFYRIKRPFQYNSLNEAKEHIKKIGKEISEGLPSVISPLVIGITGRGNVSRGVNEILELLPVNKESANDLLEDRYSFLNNVVYCIFFKIDDYVSPKTGEFFIEDYYKNPEKYEVNFERFLRFISILVNGIYWEEKYPRLIKKDKLREIYISGKSKMRMIGDITCDINGSIEITIRDGDPDNGFLTYIPERDEFVDGILPEGITDMVISNLPTEFPAEASEEFSNKLINYIEDILKEDFTKPFEELKLPPEIKKAIICHNGRLTDRYEYLREHLKDFL